MAGVTILDAAKTMSDVSTSPQCKACRRDTAGAGPVRGASRARINPDTCLRCHSADFATIRRVT